MLLRKRQVYRQHRPVDFFPNGLHERQESYLLPPHKGVREHALFGA